jgi:shikimate kinase
MSVFFLIGVMGAGKSTLAHQLSDSLGYKVLDTDKLIEQKYNSTISEIFETKGEEEFRKIELEILKELSNSDLENSVVACGGGLATQQAAIDIMKQKGEVIYLKVSEKTLADRVEENIEERPLLKNISPDELPQFFVKLLRERAKYYHQADKILAVEELNTQEIIDLIT